MSTVSNKSISRIDHPPKNTHGGYVRVAFKGEIHSRFFSDSPHQGKRPALKAARAWRDETERAVGKPHTPRTVRAVSPRNRTGVIGVRRTTKARTRDGSKVSPVYEVTWQAAPGQVRRTTFSIRKYGQAEAFRRACAFRKEKEQEVYGAALPPLKAQRRRSPRVARRKTQTEIKGESSQP
jgi:hypothetical protein